MKAGRIALLTLNGLVLFIIFNMMTNGVSARHHHNADGAELIRDETALPEQQRADNDWMSGVIAGNKQEYHSTVRVLPHVVYGMTRQEADAVAEYNRENKHCDIEQVGCTLDKLWAQVF